MIIEKKLKLVILVALGIVYFISFWLLTIGYFTPYWLLVELQGITDIGWYLRAAHSCKSIGLVYPLHRCDFAVYNELETRDIYGIGHVLKDAFILMTTAVVAVYTNAIMLVLSIVFDLIQYSFFTSLLSISFGVCYPIAAVLILVATIYVEATYKYDTGFSTMLCTIAGGLMLFFYIGLIVFDQMYVRNISKNERTKKNKHGITERGGKGQKQTSGKVGGGRRDLTVLQSEAIKTKTATFCKVEPTRVWGLRRI